MKIVAASGSKFAQFLIAAGFALAISTLPARAGSPPANDNFSDRTALTGQSVLVSTYNTNATVEPGDPSLGDRTLTRTLWWSWTAPYTGWANFSTFGSDGPLVAGVFVGDSLPDLSSVGVSNGGPWYLRYGSFPPSYQPVTGDSVNVPVQSGQTYQIEVAAPAFSNSSVGRVVLGINQIPTILSSPVVSGSVGSGLSYRISASNWPTTYDAQGLPSGVTVDPYSGIISGTPTSTGSFDAVVSAMGPGGTGQATVRFEITQANITPPVFASGNAVNKGMVGTSLNMSISISGAGQVTAHSLPPGVGFRYNSGSGSFFGTPSQAGIFAVSLHATNSAGATDTQMVFQIREKPPLPAFSSNAVAYGTVGTSFYYYLSASDMATGTYDVGSLPAGLQLSATSTISGTPTQAGTFEIPLVATNATGSTSATLTIVVADAPIPTPTPSPTAAPVFTSSAGASGFGLPPFYYGVSSNDPTARYSASGLPSGLSINPTTGGISGTPTTTGTYTASITASNAIGSTTSQLTLALQTLSPFVLMSPAMATGTVGGSFSYSFMLLSYYSGPSSPSTAPQLSIDPKNLPPGLIYKASTSTPSTYYSPFPVGSITGAPTATGTYQVPVVVTYQGETVNSTLTIAVAPSQTRVPVITSQASAAGNVGLSFSYSIGASNAPTSYAASNLPPGLTFNGSSGIIQGTPTQSGDYAVDISATNSAGTSHAKVEISIAPLPLPTVRTPAALEWFVGYKFGGSYPSSYVSPVTGSETFTAAGLPQGVILSTSGAFGGSPTTAGNYPVNLSVTNGGGTTTANLNIVATDRLPSLALPSSLFAIGNVGDTFSYLVSSSTNTGSFQFNNLPPGLTASNGFISGKPTMVGTFAVSVYVSDGGETASGILTLQINPTAAPTLTLPIAKLAYLNEGFNYTFYGSHTNSYSISGHLPKGLSLDVVGTLAGTPTETGSFPLQVTANGPGGSTTVPFTLYVQARPLPVISASLVISPYASYSPSVSATINAGNAPTSFSAQRIPANLKFANYGSYAYVSGTLAGTGMYPATITATNSTGSGSAIVTFCSNSALSSGFNSAMVSTPANEAFSYYPYSGSDPFMKGSTYSALGLPSGLAIDPSTGKITGTPNIPGTYFVNITATYASAVYIQFTLTIVVTAVPELPLITSNNILNATCGQSMGITLSHQGEVTSYSLDPIPPGLKFDSSSGYLSGTPTVAGTYNVMASATNAAGTRSANLVIQIAAYLPAPTLVDPISLLGYTGEKFDHSIQAYNSPTSYSATGLPPGLAIGTSSGKISGTPTSPGHYPVAISATNAAGTAAAVLSIDVLEARAPVISSSGYASGIVGSSFNYQLTASHSPILFTASNLPPGLGLDPSSGTISGYPIAAGDYVVPVAASNAALTGSANITIHVSNEPAGTLDSAAQAMGTVGAYTSVPLHSTASDSTFSADGLPPGLSLATGSSIISGIPTVAGHYEISIHVTTAGTETKSVLSMDIAEGPIDPPLIGAELFGFVGAGYTYPLFVSNLPAHITAEGLPEGVVLDPSTGLLSGAPKASGLYTVTITASNAVGTSTAVLNLLTIAPMVPVATTNANLYTAVTESTSLPISLSTDSYYYYFYVARYNPYYPSRYPYSPYSQPSVLASMVTVTGLPPGMIFDTASGQIEGTATKSGDYPLAITATTPLATTTTYTTLHVLDTLPATSSVLQVSSSVDLNAFGAVGSPFQLNLTSNGVATDIACTGLPDGLRLQKTDVSSNGTPAIAAAIIGSPLKAGTYPVKFTFSNAAQTASGTVTIIIPDSPELPSFSGSLAASGIRGISFSYYIGDGSGYNSNFGIALNNAASTGGGISTINVSGLPPGLQFNSSSNYITGTPTTAGSYVVPISLTNAGGTTAASVLITISDQQLAVPQLLGANGSLGASTVSFTGEPVHLALNTSDSTTNVTASGLPDGVTLGKAADGSWTLSGTPTTAGAYNLFLTATSGQGTETVPLTLNIRQLDQSIPAPQPDAMPSPSPTPVSTPPTVVVNQPRVDTTDDQVSIRGRVLAYQPGCTVTVKAGAKSWQKLRVSPNGSFKLNLANLPVGTTHVTIRIMDSEGHIRTTHIQVRRHVA
jgi:hypothetical protein